METAFFAAPPTDTGGDPPHTSKVAGRLSDTRHESLWHMWGSVREKITGILKYLWDINEN